MEEIIKMEEISVPIKIIRSERKTCSIQINPDCTVIVKAPLHMKTSEIREGIKKRAESMEKYIQQCIINKTRVEEMGKFTAEDIRAMADKAMKVIPDRVKYFASKLGVTYGRITIRNQKTKWGSCTAQGNLNFNCLLMETPPEVIDSIVAHEVCHLKHMDHSKAFYEDLHRIFPEYDKCHNWLKVNGIVLIQRMTG